jgi:acyl carrier protein
VYIPPNEHTDRTYAPPMTIMQTAILEIFNEVFPGMLDSGIDTNVFLLGISSIDLLKLRMDLQRRLRIVFPITVIFNHPTIKEMATEVRHSRRENVAPETCAWNKFLNF